MRGPRCYAVIPAAGRSVRMGQPKLLLPWQDSTVIETVLAHWQRSGAERIVVVLHPDDEQLAALCRDHDVEVKIAEPPPPDMKASVRAGLAYLYEAASPEPQDAWLVAPADMPLLTTELIDAVIAAHDPARPAIIVPRHGTRRGHPVLFPWPLAAEVSQLPENQGLKALLETHPVREVPWADAAAREDMDTPEDYRRLRGES